MDVANPIGPALLNFTKPLSERRQANQTDQKLVSAEIGGPVLTGCDSQTDHFSPNNENNILSISDFQKKHYEEYNQPKTQRLADCFE